MAYKNLNKQLSDFKKDILETLSTDGDKQINNIYKKQAEYMYTEYTPIHDHVSRYRDGQSGSFADEVNFISNIESTENGVRYKLKNYRITDCTCNYCNGKDMFLDQLLADGVAGQTFIPKRPVMDRLKEELIQGGQLNRIIKQGMKSRGWKLK